MLSGSVVIRERVNIYVDDVNEYPPVWNEQQYSAVVDEGNQHKDIIQIAATDADGSPGMSKICQYHVITPGVPFEVDELGNYSIFRHSPWTDDVLISSAKWLKFHSHRLKKRRMLETTGRYHLFPGRHFYSVKN